MPKLNAPAEIHWRRSNMNTRDPILMKSVEVLKDCRSLNAAAEMNCPMPRSVEKVPIRNEKRCISHEEFWRQAANQNNIRGNWHSVIDIQGADDKLGQTSQLYKNCHNFYESECIDLKFCTRVPWYICIQLYPINLPLPP